MPELVMDVGLYDGEDTAYYLNSGYRVVGIDADPQVIERCAARFEREISRGLLTLLNVGIADRDQTLTFYRNLSEGGQSSFLADYGQGGGEFVSLEVRCTTLRQVLESHGIPYYLKVDIEGLDEMAISSLDAKTRPRYLSAELSRSSKIIEHLHAIGYNHFKLLNGAFHTSSLPIFDNDLGWRLLRKASRTLPFLHRAIAGLPRRFRPKMEWDSPYSVNQKIFGANTAGPFGEETDGRWITHSEARTLLDRIAECEAVSDGLLAPKGSLWWDLHAKASD